VACNREILGPALPEAQVLPEVSPNPRLDAFEDEAEAVVQGDGEVATADNVSRREMHQLQGAPNQHTPPPRSRTKPRHTIS
jgi:hypothetical protein